MEVNGKRLVLTAGKNGYPNRTEPGEHSADASPVSAGAGHDEGSRPRVVRICRTRMPGRFPFFRTALATVFGASLLGFFHTHGTLILARPWPLLLWILFQPFWCILLWRRAPDRSLSVRLRIWTPLLVLNGFLLLHLFSSAARYDWFFFGNWIPLDHRLAAWGLVRLAILTALFTPLFLLCRRRSWFPYVAVMLFFQVVALYFFLNVTDGRPLYRIDHPAFMFRLHEFARTFPQLVNYMPHWNAGTVHIAGTPSGTGGPGLLLWPWLRAWPAHTVYNNGFAFLFIGLVPWLGAASVRAAGGDRTAAAAGGILAMGVSQQYFLWTLHYGTIGAGLSAAMTMPVSALVFRALWMRRCGVGTAIALIAAILFLLQWPPHGFLALGMIAAFPWVARRLTRRISLVLAGCLMVALLLYVPWMRVMLTMGRHLVDWVFQDGGDVAGSPTALSWESLRSMAMPGARHLLALLRQGNPLLLFLGFGGLLVDRHRGLRRWYLPMLIVLALITGWSTQFKPESQFSRLAIAFFFVTVVPAAILLGSILRQRDARLAPVQALLLALLLLSGWNTVRVFANRSLAPFTVMDEPVPRLVDWIRENTPEDGRILFAGRTVHAYGLGKIAYLPILTGREMMADDYYGFPIGMIEYEYPPRPFRDSLDGLLRFCEIYNVTHVISYHQRPWIRFLRSHTENFTEVFAMTSYDLRLKIFQVHRTSGLIEGAAGRIEADFNRLRVTFDDTPPETVILRYNWVPGLDAVPPARIAPYATDAGLVRVKLWPAGQHAVDIRYRPPGRKQRDRRQTADGE